MLLVSAIAGIPVRAQSLPAVPGGFVEPATATEARPRIVPPLPSRGPFTFPAPYNTTGVRLTNAGDCGGADCVRYVGYSYWRNTNNHVGSNTMLIVLSLDRRFGGGGPTLYSYDKTTDQVSVVGPLFDAAHPLSWASGEGWYWSGTQPTKLYVNQGAKLQRYDALARTLETVFDASAQFGADKYIWQMHSSADDRVHSATLRSSVTYEMLGCLVYREDTRQFSYFARVGPMDECQVDDSGRWLLIKENVDGAAGEDNVIVDLRDGGQSVLLDQAGAAGHSDMGYGYMVAADNWSDQPGSIRLWTFGPGFPAAQAGAPAQGLLVYRSADWASQMNHVSHSNARPGVPAARQYACGSGASRQARSRANEIQCFPLDGSLRVLVVAPVMTNLDAPGGGSDDYAKLPKGNLDVTGRYFIWTSNTGGNRLDAFIVKVPSELLGITPEAGPSAPAAPNLVAAVLPASRSVLVGDTAVALATVINTGAGVGRQCVISPTTSVPGTFMFQVTDATTNRPAGTVDGPVEIEPGASRTFVFGVKAESPMPSTDIALSFRCANGDAAPSTPGLNTLLFSASTTPGPDIVALTATPTGDGIVDLPGARGAAAFAVAVANVGVGGMITATADTGSANPPVTLLLCQTNPATGRCGAAPRASVTTRIEANAMPAFAVFIQGNGVVPFDPAHSRIVVRFKDEAGSTRGATSVAVRTR